MIQQYKKASEEDVWGLATGEETGKKGRKSKARFVLFCFVFPSARIRSDSQGERRLKAEGTLSKEDIHQDRGSAAPSSPRGGGWQLGEHTKPCPRRRSSISGPVPAVR